MKLVRVVAAAVINANGEVLIAKRPDHVHQGGLWEFPGGKIEPDETPQQALSRELEEEIGITPLAATPLIKITHHYPDKSVHLDVWKVTAFQGEAVGMEGQPIRWQSIDALSEESFPAANKAIIDALQLPNAYMITGEWDDLNVFSTRLQRAVDQGVSMVQLRLKNQSPAVVKEVVACASAICHPNNVKVILNAESAFELIDIVDGIHLSSSQLEEVSGEKLADFDGKIIGVSCHNKDEIDKAVSIGATYISVSPVLATQTHPGQEPLGWGAFSALADYATIPAYALGGMQRENIDQSIEQGGQGIAAIGAFWG